MKITMQFILHLSLVSASSYVPSLKPFMFERVDGMCRGENVPIRVNFTIVKRERNAIVFNATVNVREDVDGVPQAIISITRCRSKENLDSCELFYTSPPDNYCNIINPKVPAFSPFYLNYSPIYKCPIKKGIHVAYNSKVDFTKFLIFPLRDWYWKSTTYVRDPNSNKLVFCLKIEGREIR